MRHKGLGIADKLSKNLISDRHLDNQATEKIFKS